ncbi:putative pectinesterase/pectinesterase inhibitor 28 [Sesamum angolense]|uniref:Pectinesterase n=1 Tax=Sesamum angolense TaxID=2727404 RepID=A0AAE1X628_9LAMI|nr:putative pectinesterase/pectinesterase inhibitor 28 [Sesamum angolense]
MAAKKAAIITMFATLVVAAVVAAVIIVQKKNQGNNNINSSQKAIVDLCQNTYYQESCVSSLSKATISSDTKDLIRASFQTAMQEIGNVIKQSATLQEASKNPETAKAYQTCQKLLNDSILDLQKTLERTECIDISNLNSLIDDIKTWLTGALTYQETCLDCFEDAEGDAAGKMREFLKLGRELTINGLALANGFSNLLVPSDHGAGRRRLLAHSNKMGLINKVDYVGELWLNHATRTRRLLHAAPGDIKPHVTVAKDGSGNFMTIGEALKSVPLRCNDTYIIYIKAGVSGECYCRHRNAVCHVHRRWPKCNQDYWKQKQSWGTETFWTATVGVDGDNFIAKDIGFENSAGASMHQAVALRASGDRSIFFNCQIDGYQDTVFAHNHRQFFRDCTISGTIDFIFGNARAVFQNCTLLVRKPLENQKACLVTAEGRTTINETSAIVLQNCRILPAPEYPINDPTYKTYLGRPWKPYSRTIIMDSHLDSLIEPEGWAPWNVTAAHLDTCWYAELNNKGPGADLSRRVAWPGIKKITVNEADDFTPGQYMVGDSWIAGKGIPYDSGLILAP